MLVSAFDYDLPEELIAQHPAEVRGTSRMLMLDRRTGAVADHVFTDLPALLRPGDLVVLNDSRVIPARLFATRAGLTTQHNSPAPSGLVEVLLTERLASGDGNGWSALVRPARKIQPGETLLFHQSQDSKGPAEAPALTATVVSAGNFGERTLRFAPVPDFYTVLERIGHLPLPPYIHRSKTAPDTAEDRERYQTVYSKPIAELTPAAEMSGPTQGSAAAPTAGLHFTPEVLEALRHRGVELATVTLHVGLGTFQPVRAERTEDIRLHAEPYTLPAATAAALNRAKSEGRRIIAVGTTTTRTLEHIARQSMRTGSPIAAHSGSTSLFLSPRPPTPADPGPAAKAASSGPSTGDHDFHLVSGLLTNFHLPQSTLVMLVSAFAGREHVLAAYAHAVRQRYRFFSYGDCMLIL
jgi:S-adenosylmethionine:tRNA ribosyltransferase-isomerase